jgi:starch synthase
VLRFDGDLARRVYAAADFVVVPSRFEPCGLTQLYALRYGAVPLVTSVGGLRDTVEPMWADHSRGTGIHVGDATPHEVSWGVRQAFSIYHHSRAFDACRRRGMERDSSWDRAALRYVALYERVGARG